TQAGVAPGVAGGGVSSAARAALARTTEKPRTRARPETTKCLTASPPRHKRVRRALVQGTNSTRNRLTLGRIRSDRRRRIRPGPGIQRQMRELDLSKALLSWNRSERSQSFPSAVRKRRLLLTRNLS